MVKRIDPHTHSAYSDGTDTPAQLLAAAARAGLDAIALTDHDTTDGWDEACAAVSATGVSLIRGAEISCSASGISAHLLAYLFDPANPGLLDVFRRTRQDRETRARRIVDNLSADYPISWEDVLDFAPEGGPVGRPHIADALVRAGCFPDRGAAFVHALHPSGPYYVHHWAPDPVEAVRLVLKAGGVPVLAHPRARGRSRLLPEAVIGDMADAGLFGIERDHRDHGPQDRADVERIGGELGLALFGSSDYHGSGKPNRIGENTTDPATIAEVVKRGYIGVVEP
ncbi:MULTISPECIES: PHP domain-containing protein [Actinomycetaceae]|uniref:PHP domain-containing protein n=1 Tax=Actinomycetaceae TaxID=2049 RepID=UPI0001F0FC38|nr:MULTISPECIES: PHP domain-containing protein [Actinomycetaceae]EFU61398.1 PHP domain protein [Actinomyces sp. oral taxon 180 str. F0310]MCM3899176.1 PHP domain-containing protein [Schaalia meyeri]UUO93663.1 PHP domain-containing protein [Schaalia odontolytica]